VIVAHPSRMVEYNTPGEKPLDDNYSIHASICFAYGQKADRLL